MTALGTVLRLARVSNLPTVWSNVLAALVLAEGIELRCLALVLVAMSALYAGGMVLNDAFDQDIDARERPDRPIPAGDVAPRTVWLLGFALLAAGVALLALFGLASALGGAALAGAILIYDTWHKGNLLSPMIMGACRGQVYVATGLAVSPVLPPSLVIAALALFFYVTALTRAAKGGAFQSLATSWPAVLLALPAAVALIEGYNISGLAILLAAAAAGVIGYAIWQLKTGAAGDRERGIGLLIAAIAIMDAVVATTHGSPSIALVCCGLFVLTLMLQRVVPGT